MTHHEYRGYVITRAANKNFRTPDRLWRVSVHGKVIHRCSSLILARRYVDAAVKIDAHRDSQSAVVTRTH